MKSRNSYLARAARAPTVDFKRAASLEFVCSTVASAVVLICDQIHISVPSINKGSVPKHTHTVHSGSAKSTVSGPLSLINRWVSLAATTKSILTITFPLENCFSSAMLLGYQYNSTASLDSGEATPIFFGQSDPTQDLLPWVIVLVCQPASAEL